MEYSAWHTGSNQEVFLEWIFLVQGDTMIDLQQVYSSSTFAVMICNEQRKKD